MHKLRVQSVEKLLSAIMARVLQQWLCPVNECLRGTSEQLLETVWLLEELRSGEVELWENAETLNIGEGGIVSCFWF